MSETIHYDRRRFIGTAVTAMADAGLVASRLGKPFHDFSRVATKSSTNASLGAVEQSDGGNLNVRYIEAGPRNGPPAILLHGINSDIDVAPLAARGYRVIMTAATVSGSDEVSLAANQRALPPKEELEWWYRFYFLREGPA
jgi:hypothetical protein